MSRNCCAHGCASTTQTTPFRKFYTLTQVRASLTEWLLALNRLDILADFTIRKKADSFSICEVHFPSIQKDAANTITPVKNDPNGKNRFTNNKETQTDTTAPTLMITPVEIVDIQPEAVNNMPRIDAFNVPAIPGQPTVNAANVGALGGFVNMNPGIKQMSNIPGFRGNIAPIKTMAPVQVKTSRNLAPPKILRKIRPKINGSIPGYIINLNGLQSTPATMNIVDMAGSATATNYNQPGGNVTLSVPNTSAGPSMDNDKVETVHDALEVEDLIKIDVDDEGTELITDDYVSEYGESNIDTEPGEFENDIVRIQFPTSEADAQEEDDGHYVKFEVEESSDKMETYCFFDEDNEVTAKKRKVETMDGGFQIVKLEVEPDRTII